MQSLTLSQWTDRINRRVEVGTAAVIQIGNDLMKAGLQHEGEFNAWLESGALKFSRSSAHNYLRTGESFGHRVQMFAQVLPPDLMSIYEAAHLGREKADDALDAGRLHPEMSLDEIAELVSELTGQPKRKYRQKSKIKSRPRDARGKATSWQLNWSVLFEGFEKLAVDEDWAGIRDVLFDAGVVEQMEHVADEIRHAS